MQALPPPTSRWVLPASNARLAALRSSRRHGTRRVVSSYARDATASPPSQRRRARRSGVWDNLSPADENDDNGALGPAAGAGWHETAGDMQADTWGTTDAGPSTIREPQAEPTAGRAARRGDEPLQPPDFSRPPPGEGWEEEGLGGWGAAGSGSSTSGDDAGGWGEPYVAHDWGEAYTPLGAEGMRQGGTHAADTPLGAPTPGHPHQPPAQDPAADATSDPGEGGWDGAAPQWQFFADDGRGDDGAPPEPAGPAPPPSDVTLLARAESDVVLPVTPNGRQADYFRPRTISERLVQLMGALGASMALSKSTVLAAPALLYPLWSPWIRAALKNAEVFGGAVRHMGLWRAEVLEVEVQQNNVFRPGSWGRRGGGLRVAPLAGPTVRLLMGDPWEGGARVQFEFPYQPKCELLQPGEAVEALVLARDTDFATFKVIREVYVPGLGLWLAEYPFLDRSAFLDLSLQIERARQGEGEAAWPEGGPPGGVRYTVDVDIADPQPEPPLQQGGGNGWGGAAGAGSQTGYATQGADSWAGDSGYGAAGVGQGPREGGGGLRDDVDVGGWGGSKASRSRGPEEPGWGAGGWGWPAPGRRAEGWGQEQAAAARTPAASGSNA